jgi:type III pantothenate kinase
LILRHLLVDLGNSRAKLAWVSSPPSIDFLAAAESLPDVLARVNETPNRIWLSSVGEHARTDELCQLLQARWDTSIERVDVPRFQHHLATRYDPGQLGVDRWLALLACVDLSPGPALVVDAGTAITLDLLDTSGEHVGGYILPGLKMAESALLEGTAIRLPDGNREDFSEMGATNTASAIHQGTTLSVVALIERLSDRLGEHGRLYVGGGDAHRLSELLTIPHDKVDHLVLRGLARLALLEEE